jgi:UPF0042 nucleotide-binding protein
MSFLIVSGLSGSGKSIALQALEDMGYYCIDNLPAALLPPVARELTAGAERRVAVGMDARNRAFLDALPASLKALRASGVDYRIVFLDANDAVLVKRFQETRRRHPLTNDGTPLLEGIRLERELLAPLATDPALRVDTSHITPHELRHRIHEFAQGSETRGITLLFQSFGFKKGTPIDADFVFDVRCLPNPHWQPDLRPLTGLDAGVAAFLERHEPVGRLFDDVRGLLERWLPAFEQEHRSYLTVALGCTGGQHRSVYLAKRLHDHFAAQGIKTQIRHRELS